MTQHTSPITISRSTYVFSLVTTASMALLSVIGLTTGLYATEITQNALAPNDWVNLLIGLPVLLLTMSSSRRNPMIAGLLWAGALFYVVYDYLVYSLSPTQNGMGYVYLALALFTLYIAVRLIREINVGTVYRQVRGSAPDRLAGGILAGLGISIVLNALYLLIAADPTPTVGTSTMIVDVLLGGFWIIGGLLLWYHEPAGYALGMACLFQASLLFVGLLAFLILQPMMTEAVLALTDLLVSLLLSVVCFIPFILFVRRATKSRDSVRHPA